MNFDRMGVAISMHVIGFAGLRFSELKMAMCFISIDLRPNSHTIVKTFFLKQVTETDNGTLMCMEQEEE